MRWKENKKLKVSLDRFRVKEGKSAVVDEWLAFLNQNMKDTLLTLEGEKMYVESIHREMIHGREYLYWYSLQGEGGKSVYESDSYIDVKHLQYWDECIDDEYKENEISAEVVMIPDKVKAALQSVEEVE